MSWLKRNSGYIVLALAVAFAVHVASVALIPRLVMHVALQRMSARGINTMIHSPRATSDSRAVVRPSPDLLYSACPFDLAKAGALRVSVSGMPKTYWSISIFDAATDNVFALNDSAARDGSAEVILAPMDARHGAGPGAAGIADRGRGTVRVYVPTARGLVLVRTLIDDEKRLSAIDSARRTARCAPYRG